MDNYSDYMAYFQGIASNNKRIKTFKHGNAEEIINATRSEIEYPCLWLEDAEVNFTGDADSLTPVFSGAFTVFWNTNQAQNFTHERHTLNQCYLIAVSIISQMCRDSDEGNLEFAPESVSLNYIGKQFNDNDVGYRAEFEIEFNPLSDCLDDLNWVDSLVSAIIPKFHYENAVEGSFEITANLTATPEDYDWDLIEWYYKIDDGAEVGPVEVDEDEFNLTSLGSIIYLRLKLVDDNSKEYWASIAFAAEKIEGESNPFLYNQFK